MAVVGLLQPGTMGARIGGELVGAGHQVRWLTTGRSDATRQRADAEGLSPMADVAALVDGADVVLSVLPPQAALDVARQVARAGFTGTYVDANPVAPATLAAVRAAVEPGATLVDAGVVGPPPREGHRTHLYLAGPADTAETVAALVSGPRLVAVVVGPTIGQASAAKQAYALFNKGRMVLASIAADLAEAHGVSQVLAAEADRPGAELLAELPELQRGLAEVGWRWAPEMDELAAALTAAGAGPAAAGVLDRLAAELRRLAG